MLDITKIKAVSLDLDDTLWPIEPTLKRAKKVLRNWLIEHAPMTAALFSNPMALHEIRNELAANRPHLKNDLSAMRREAIRLALYRAGEDPLLAERAFAVFFAERQQVTLFDDAHSTLQFLAKRFPLVSISNGNADLERIGLRSLFRASICAREFGVAKPDPRIFRAAAGALDLTPAEVLHVGDDATLDALGALNAGMQAAWLNRTDRSWPHEGPQPQVALCSLHELCDLFK